MGLDNGLIIKGKTPAGKVFLEEKYSYLKEEWRSDDDDYEYEFGYWRKCWNIRARFSHIIGLKDSYYTYLTFAELKDFETKVLQYFLEEDNWEVDGVRSQIFSWIEELPSIANAMRNIHFFLEDMEDNDEGLTEDDFEIYFYDSY